MSLSSNIDSVFSTISDVSSNIFALYTGLESMGVISPVSKNLKNIRDSLMPITTIDNVLTGESGTIADLFGFCGESIFPYTCMKYSNLSNLILPYADLLGSYAFSGCQRLQAVCYGGSRIDDKCFMYCSSLKSFYYLGGVVPSLGTDIFSQGAIAAGLGKIYVLPSCLQAFQDAIPSLANRMFDIPQSYIDTFIFQREFSSKTYMGDRSSIYYILHRGFHFASFEGSVSFPNCLTVGGYGFIGAKNLTSIELPHCICIHSAAFSGVSSLTSVSIPNCAYIAGAAFANASRLTSISLPGCAYIGYNAFVGTKISGELYLPKCKILEGGFRLISTITKVNAPVCISIKQGFQNCSQLSQVSLPCCIFVGQSAFIGTDLRELNLPVCKEIDRGAFLACSKLTSVQLPECRLLNDAFYNCSRMEYISIPKCESILQSTFCQCYFLESISLPACRYIDSFVFYNCSRLSSVYLTGGEVCTLGNGNAFYNTPLSNTYVSGGYGSIFVPASLISTYKTATNWAAYSSRITAL